MQACQIKLAKFVAELVPPQATEKATTLWKAGLLTGMPTHIANVLGNMTMQGLEIAKHPIATAVDAAVARRTGIRTRRFNLHDVVVGSKEGAKKGFRDGEMARAFASALAGAGIGATQGDTPEEHFANAVFGATGGFILGRMIMEARAIRRGEAPFEPLAATKAWDQGREVGFDSPILDLYTKTIFRSLSSADAPFKLAALERSLREQARILANASPLLPGETIASRMQRLLDVPTDEMVTRAILDAEEATFNDFTPLAAVASGIKRAAADKGGGIGRILSEAVMPFTRVPSNVATRTVEYSPIGFLLGAKDLVELFRIATNGDVSEVARLQRRAVDRMGRASVGTLPILTGYLLAQKGLMTASYPKDQRTQAQWELEGKQEGAVLVGGKWHSVQRFSPFGNLLTLGAHIHEAGKSWEAKNGVAQNLGDQAQQAAALVATTTASIGTTLTEQSFMSGFQRANQALADPLNQGEKYVQQTLGSVVPSIVARTAQSMDPTVRETGGGFLDPIQARIPGLSQRLPQKVDALGEPIRREPDFITNFIAPTNARVDKRNGDVVRREVARVGLSISRLRQDTKNGETKEQFYVRRERDGQFLRQQLAEAIQSDAYADIAQGVRWLAQAAPQELGNRNVEEVIREQQAEFLKGVVRATRTYLAQERKASLESADIEQ